MLKQRGRIVLGWVATVGMVSACGGGPVQEAPKKTADKEAAAPGDYRPDGIIARSLPEISTALRAGETTSEELTQAYLDRIDAIDRAGPTLQAVLAINPHALDDAKALDEAFAKGEIVGPLHGVPILLKDNIESADPMATTAGSFALMENVTGRDSPLVAGLREQGAIILGKTNLSQWANFRSSDSMSGWSSLGGQVRNPHILDRNPCGSSSGSGVAAAASLAAGTVGTETNGSIICPSNVNGIVGFKPTVGLVPQDLIVPISSSQDTAGPMTKTVSGAAMMLTAMAKGGTGIDYSARLSENALQGVRVGVMRFATGSNHDIHMAFDTSLAIMDEAGAELIEIDSFDGPETDNFWDKALTVLEYEFKATLNDYLANAAPAVVSRTLVDVIAFNDDNAGEELTLFGQDTMVSSEARGDLTDTEYLEALRDVQTATRQNGIDKLLAQYRVDVLVAPSGPVAPRVDPINGDVWPDWAGAGYLAAVAGYPHLTVPMGTIDGIPVGLSFMGASGEDAQVLSYGFAFEQASNARVEPQYLPTAEAQPDIAAAMARKDR
ncbi:MAG: amidase [Pseudomonadota bacterium]